MRVRHCAGEGLSGGGPSATGPVAESTACGLSQAGSQLPMEEGKTHEFHTAGGVHCLVEGWWSGSQPFLGTLKRSGCGLKHLVMVDEG